MTVQSYLLRSVLYTARNMNVTYRISFGTPYTWVWYFQFSIWKHNDCMNSCLNLQPIRIPNAVCECLCVVTVSGSCEKWWIHTEKSQKYAREFHIDICRRQIFKLVLLLYSWKSSTNPKYSICNPSSCQCLFQFQSAVDSIMTVIMSMCDQHVEY